MVMSVKTFGKLLKVAGQEFLSDRALTLSASLSYYTIISIAPILIIIISLAGIFFGTDAVEGKMYTQIHGLVGQGAAVQIQSIVKSAQVSQHSSAGAIFGFIVLLIGASGIFTEMQESINSMWSVRSKPGKAWLKIIFNRLLSFLLIAGIGFLVLLSLLFNALMKLMAGQLRELFPHAAFGLLYFLNMAFIFISIASLSAAIFKILPDASIHWRDALVGALFTSLLFMMGKFLIGFYLGSFRLDEAYGATASILLILLWIYYSSIILYFGAAFTKVFALQSGRKIRPGNNAVPIVRER